MSASTGTSRAQEGADAAADRRHGAAPVRRARLRGRDGRRGRARGRRRPRRRSSTTSRPRRTSSTAASRPSRRSCWRRSASASRASPCSPRSGLSCSASAACSRWATRRGRRGDPADADRHARDHREPGAARARAPGLRPLRGGARGLIAGRGRRRGRTRSSPAPSRTPSWALHRALIGYVRERVAAGASASQIRRGVRAQAKRAFARLEDGLGEYAVKA